ncbi:MAG TPA: hypothetical protein VGH23_05500 [Rhizomicrobium sp.]|jgi:hypothetical protein
MIAPNAGPTPAKAPTGETTDRPALFVPPIAICILHDNPSLAPQFDAKYGAGLAAKYLAVH